MPKGLAVLVMVISLGGCVVEGPLPPGPGPYLYDYYFYPSVGVYFDIYSGYYYYHSDGRWVHTLVLPPNIHLDQRDRHRFESKNPEPYRKDKEHRERFKPIPDYKSNRDYDRKEREYNRQSHEKYRDNRQRDDKRREKDRR